MEPDASAALIAAIVAVVLGALGLVGGVIGYVQGTAALRRATLTRQRASVAEEAALQAQAQAEQAARVAQSALDRLHALGVRSSDDAVDQPSAPPTLAVVDVEPAELRAHGDPRLGDPDHSGQNGSAARQEEPEADATRPPDATATDDDPVTAPALPAPVDIEPEPEPESPPEPEPEPESPPEPESASAPTEEFARAEFAEVPPQDRAVTGRVTAGAQVPPTMEWDEVLSTGAIPLPSRSRGTYAAPSTAQRATADQARFEIHPVGRQSYQARNVGGATAEQARVEGAGEDRHLVRPVEVRAVPVQPGAALLFSVLRVEGRNVSVRVSWLEAGADQQVELPLP